MGLVDSEFEPVPGDRNFDDFVTRFERNIYDSPKGQIRLQLLLEDLQNSVPGYGTGGLHILDAGCGSAMASSRIAALGHSLVLCDTSAAMLDQARARLGAVANSRAVFHHLPLQHLGTALNTQFDMVMAHAVLEWLADSRAGFDSLLPLVKPGGYLSLLVYNRHSLVYRHLIAGNYRRLNNRDVAGFGGTLTPTNPLDPYQVEAWIAQAGLTITCQTGMRCFYDYLTPQVKRERTMEEILQMEARYGRQKPFLYVARYIHYLCQRPATSC